MTRPLVEFIKYQPTPLLLTARTGPVNERFAQLGQNSLLQPDRIIKILVIITLLIKKASRLEAEQNSVTISSTVAEAELVQNRVLTTPVKLLKNIVNPIAMLKT